MTGSLAGLRREKTGKERAELREKKRKLRVREKPAQPLAVEPAG